MFAIIEVGSRQVKVASGDIIEIPRSKHERQLTIDKVLMICSGKDVEVGAPYLKDTKVVCEVLGQTKGEKKIAYKFKKRKGYHRKVGHRDMLTKVRVKEIARKS